VIGWGWKTFNRSEMGFPFDDVIAITAGWDYSLFLKNDGTVEARGWNTEGQSAVPTGLSGVIAISAGYDHVLALRNDGTLVAWGSNSNRKTEVEGLCLVGM